MNPAVVAPRRESVSARGRRDGLRGFGFALSDDPGLRGCGRIITLGLREQTAYCHRKWLCPVCGHIAAQRERKRLERRLSGWCRQGKALGMLTLTQHHQSSDRLAVLWDRSGAGWTATTRGSGWNADRDLFGLRGFIRVAEIVHHANTGWNVHLHVLLLLDDALGPEALSDLKDRLGARFAKGLSRCGGQAVAEGQDLRLVDPQCAGEIAANCLKGTTEYRSTNGSRSPIGILSDLESTGEGFELWKEFTDAVTTRRRYQFRTSRGIDLLCGQQCPADANSSRLPHCPELSGGRTIT
jgi:hypothetical protein